MQQDLLDRQPIKDKFRAVSFSFYTEDEVRAMSVKKIANPVAFDHMNNPTAGGLHDKALGVSPFDNLSNCETCGLSQSKCPGHCGHIELTAPIYNPFLFKEVYKLLKAKCFGCHKLRIHPDKVAAFTNALKMLKAGGLVEAQKVKQHGLSANKASTLFKEDMFKDTAADPKYAKLQAYHDEAAAFLGKVKGGKKCKEPQKLRDMYGKIVEQFDERKDQHAEALYQMQTDVVLDAREKREAAERGRYDLSFEEYTTTTQKTILELQKEIWASVITTSCPNCPHKSPGIKRDGFTKLFVKKLSSTSANVEKQKKRIAQAQMSDMDHQSQTNASTHLDIKEDDTAQVQKEESEESFDEAETKPTGKQEYIRPDNVQKHLKNLWREEEPLLSLLYGKFDPSEDALFNVQSQGHKIFFMNLVIVPPTRFRPESEGSMGGGQRGDRSVFLHQHSAMLTKVIQSNQNLSTAILDLEKPEVPEEAKEDQKYVQGVNQLWIQLQDAVNTFMDSSMAQKTAEQEKQGVRQLLERKEGMFRKKMMGKRVDYGGRSVISPDPNITTDEIGVPVFMARKLTFPESVCQINAERLASMVRNGPLQHPGANMVLDEQTGIQTLLSRMTDEQREGIANKLKTGRQIVYRHLSNGDPLLVNRQPTLHKPSIMAHVARVLPKEQTIRMHYANCSTYNADFDGDEMNIHMPQSYEARAEALSIMATHKQYIIPTSGKPIRGLIQDSVLAGVRLSCKDTFLQKDEYMQLVYAGLRELIEEGALGRAKLLPPAMIKPKILWTGKQVVSTILKNIVMSKEGTKQQYKEDCGMNLDSKSRLPAKEWGPLGKEEGEVIIRDNELLQGTIDKNQFGNSDQGMVHCFYELYGSKKAGKLLTALTRIFADYLQSYGHTVGIDDLVLRPEANKRRRMIIEEGHQQGVISAAKFADIPDFQVKKLNYSSRIVFQSKGKMDKDIEAFNKMSLPKDPFSSTKKCIQGDDRILSGLETKIGQCASLEDKEALDTEFDGHMKGTMSNVTSRVLKECIPQGLFKRFPKNNISAMVLTGAKGGLVNQTQISALLGQQELEGRRVPKMQNGKTLPSFLAFDPNPRASGYVSDRFITGLRPQDFFFHCMAGREGLIDTAVKTSRSGYLQRCLIKQLESLVVKYDMTVRDSDNSIIQFLYGEDGVDVMETKFLDKFKFFENNFRSLPDQADELIEKKIVDAKKVQKHKHKMEKQAKKLYKESNKKISKEQALQQVMSVNPILNLFDPKRHIGAIAASMEQKLEAYVKNDLNSKHKVLDDISSSKKPSMKFAPVDIEAFKKMYYHKYLKSVVDPGENVGTIAAQSIGEPSTQMTLNTFHLAGHGGANMTLGIPRMKEILMTTPSNIKTPCMTVHLQKDTGLSLEQIQTLANSYQKLKMSDIVKEVKLGQEKAKGAEGKICRVYRVTLEFEEADMLKEKLGINFTHIKKVFCENFVPRLMHETLSMMRKAAENEAGGAANLMSADLKKVIAVTTSATKKSKGVVELKEEELEQGPEKKDSDDEDKHNDTDGLLKQKTYKYDPDDSEQVADKEDPSEQEQQTGAVDEPKEKDPQGTASKYHQFMKGDFEYVKDTSATVTLSFPIEYKKLLLMTIVDTVLDKVLVRNVPGIDRCTLIPPSKPGDEPYLFVQGINFQAFEKHPEIFDLNRVETNHSYELKNRYGVEACRANIVKEIRSVFAVYGIDVNYRHLSLIGDFVTYNGDYRAFNRIGMEESSSPFLKMSFETTMKYLVGSAMVQDTDWITSPSSAIVVGQPPAVGCSTFDLIQEQAF